MNTSDLILQDRDDAGAHLSGPEGSFTYRQAFQCLEWCGWFEDESVPF